MVGSSGIPGPAGALLNRLSAMLTSLAQTHPALLGSPTSLLRPLGPCPLTLIQVHPAFPHTVKICGIKPNFANPFGIAL